MISIRPFLLSIIPLALLVAGSANADAIFNLENVASGTATPVSTTVNGLTASFSAGTVCNGTVGNFATLSGNVLTTAAFPNGCGANVLGPVNIGFSSTLSSVSLNFATAGRPSEPFTLQAFQGSTLVGTSLFTSSAPPGNLPNGEGVASFSGSFNNVVLFTNGSTPGSFGGPFAIDNINAVTAASGVPEPASLSMFAAGGLVLAGLARRARKRQAS